MSEEETAVKFTDNDGEEQIIPLDARIQTFSGFVDDELISRIVDAFGSTCEFTCAVYHKKTGVGNKTLVGNYRNEIPMPDEIGSIVGSGRLQYMISAKGKSKKREMKDFWVDLASNFDDKAEENKIEANRRLMLRAGGNSSNNRNEIAMFDLLGKVLLSKDGGSQTEQFRLIMDMQNKSEDRMMRVMEKMSENFEKAMEKASSSNGLAKLAESIALIKELSGSFAGGDAKHWVAELIEATSPMICTAMERFGGKKVVQKELTKEENPEEQDMREIPVTPANLDSIEKQLIEDFPKLAKAMKNPVKRIAIRKSMKEIPVFSAIFADNARLERIRLAVGDEIFQQVHIGLTLNPKTKE